MESPGIEVKEAHSLREAQVCSLHGILITDREAYGTFCGQDRERTTSDGERDGLKVL